MRGDSRFARRTSSYEIVQDPVRHRFVESALIAVGREIELERLALDAKPIRNVIDVDPREVRLTGHRTKAGEIVRLEMNVIIPARRVWKHFERRVGRCGGQFSFTSTEQRQGRRLGFRAFHRLNVQRATGNVQLSNPMDAPNRQDRIGVIDMIAHDPKTDEAVLVMNELEPWNDSDERLLQLQERFNAYVSFLLDGEFAEWDPKLARKRARIEMRCAHMPDSRAIELLGQIRDQLAHQEIDVQVIVKESA